MSGSRDLLINHSLQGSGGDQRKALELLKSNFFVHLTGQLAGIQLHVIVRYVLSHLHPNHHDILCM